MSFLSGKAGRLYANGSYWKIQKWSVQISTEILDVTHGESGGFGEFIKGVDELKFTVDACHDVGTNPFGTFVPGTGLALLQLQLDSDTNNGWIVNDAKIETVKENLQVKGAPVTWRVEGTASQTGIAQVGGNVSWRVPQELGGGG